MRQRNSNLKSANEILALLKNNLKSAEEKDAKSEEVAKRKRSLALQT